MTSTLLYLFVAVIWWVVFCRARQMDAHTPARAKWQHSISLVLAVLALPAWGWHHSLQSVFLAASFAFYLGVDARRGVRTAEAIR